MAPLCLVRPTSEDAEILWDYRREFLENGEVIHGGAGLANAASPQAWLQALEQNSCEESVAPGLVPATTLLAIRQNNLRMVGIIDIRHRLNDYLFRYGGHIGYSVRKSERRKGYAAAMLHQALLFCREELGISRVLLTCDRCNLPSSRAIRSQGGVLENEILEGVSGELVQRYWIDSSSL
ncbi:MAG: GNAT family N-acetyltransferase [Oscillospiraceae bacterium]|nr:GNAT family N-acetyltransferase [Oscillospiraceae bacterium]